MRHSAAVVLTRNTPRGVEVFLVERSPNLRFFGGFWAFPGGVVDPVDQLHDDEELLETLERCALRELFEETGILPGALEGAIAPERRLGLRERLVTMGLDAEPWREYVQAADRARAELTLVTTVTTPPFSPLRHRTPFLHLSLPAGQVPQVISGELVRGRFWRAEDLLKRWRAGELSVVPPALFLLDHLVDGDLARFFQGAGAAGRAMDQGALNRAYCSPGVMCAPLRTPTLPPATTTNTVLIGEERVFIVDPATPERSEQERLFETLDRWRDAGRELAGILLTHHHHDHVGGVRATAERYGLPVLAHQETLVRVKLDGLETRPVEDGECLELGRSPDGREGWQLQAHLTPGHAHGHLVFIENRYRTAVVGDLVSTLSTIVIDPPEGHMRTYIESLEAILAKDIGVLVPAHGPAQRLGAKTLRYHLKRRVQREEKLLAAVGAGPSTLESLLPVVYDDAPAEVLPYARRSLLAGLEKLVEDGKLRQSADSWELATT